ncbi:alpha/beta fold hydrolase [Microbacterium sp. P02]|uniref:alpha/beta hydrolase n=1 Tax=Microbacterium sp. P02 TaxID=3366260 RepID=UPI00366AA0E7
MNAAPTLYALHALGSSAREFDGLSARLQSRLRVVGIELPGFGDEPVTDDLSVAGLADHVIARIVRDGAQRWMLAGHSMGGKVASVVAARVLNGTANLFGLTGVVLLAASPPTPEPMAEERRAQMLSWVQDGPLGTAEARTFIDMNIGSPLDPADDAVAESDLRRASPVAWRHWLESGSREDVSDAVGVLDLPAVVLGGDDDEDLGAKAQPDLHGRFYPRARFVTLPGAGHLLPYERTDAVADAALALWDEIERSAPAVPAQWSALIASSRTDQRVRATLARRAIADDPEYAPQVLTPAAMSALRALADVVVPQPDGPRIDLAARVDAQLHRGEGDGWRVADMPPDPEAYRSGLDAIASAMEGDMGKRRAAVRSILDESFTPPKGWTGQQLSAWFEDARVDLVRQWMAHPATMAHIGYDGFATGGTVLPLRGFSDLRQGARDAWEPTELGEERSV